MIYGAECWAGTKKYKQQLHTNEICILRLKFRNNFGCSSFKVMYLSDKLADNPSLL